MFTVLLCLKLRSSIILLFSKNYEVSMKIKEVNDER